AMGRRRWSRSRPRIRRRRRPEPDPERFPGLGVQSERNHDAAHPGRANGVHRRHGMRTAMRWTASGCLALAIGAAILGGVDAAPAGGDGDTAALAPQIDPPIGPQLTAAKI